MKSLGKKGLHWLRVRRQWIRQNPPDFQGYWYCYLRISPNCHGALVASSLTLDHVLSRGRHPELAFNLDNLKPACGPCNVMKGSRDADQVLLKS